MEEYNNIILLRDNGSRYFDIDMVILTNETKETIENEIENIKHQWYENNCDYSLLEEIQDKLTEKYDIAIYYSHNEIYY